MQYPSSDRSLLRQNLRRTLSPRHVAFVGGLTNIPAIEMLRATGFDGDIWAVHPTRTEVAGCAVYPSVNDLPEAPDAAFLNVPRAAVNGLLRDLDAREAGGAVCFAAGYAELGQAGAAAQAELSRAARNLAVIGPNSTGFLNYFDRTALWPVRDHEPRQMEKGVAIVSASGGVLFNYSINQRSLRAAVMVGIGNQAVLEVADYVAVLAEDPRVTAIGLFMEDIGDPIAFSHAAAKALENGIPVVALKTGASAKGAEVARTHSGALVAPDDMINALFARAGVIRVNSLPALDETLKMLTIPRRPTGRRMALLTNSGGEKALAADAADGTVIEFPMTSPPVTESLRRQIPEFAAVSNPFDYNAFFAGEDIFSMENEPALRHCFQTMIADGYDIAMILNGYRSLEDCSVDPRESVLNPTRDAFIKACDETGICGIVTATLPEHLPYAQREHLVERGIAPLLGLSEAMTAVDATIRWCEWTEIAAGKDLGLPRDPGLPNSGRFLNEAEGKATIAELGLQVPEARIASDADSAAKAAARIGFPVVLKVLEPVFAHKMKAGGVALSLGTAEQVRAAMSTMSKRLAADGHIVERVLLERMVRDTRSELILGVKYVPRFGHALVLGHGGTAVEDLGLADTILLPSSDTDIEAFVGASPAVRNLTDETRGRIFMAAKAVMRYTAMNRDRLVSLDVNPLIVSDDGRLTAADVLIELSN